MKNILMLVAVLATACAEGPIDGVESNRDSLTWDEFLTMVYQEPDTGVYIANGDEMYETVDQLRELYARLVTNGSLIVNTVGGADDRWFDPIQHDITYCVSTSFGARYGDVVTAMASATGAWEAAGDVVYRHVESADSDCDARNTSVVFDVRPVNSGCQYLARAFFPSNGRRNRNILIDSCSFDYGNSPSVTGVLRHELGHTLGFRHEHTRPEAGTCFEDTSWRALTPYDSDSVMHYPQCNGTGTWSLTLTTLDRDGAEALYGAPSGGGGGSGGGDGVCLPKTSSCTADADCCSGHCGGKPGNRTCK